MTFDNYIQSEECSYWRFYIFNDTTKGSVRGNTSNNMSDSQKETTWTSDLGFATIILETNNRMTRKGSITI